MRLAIKSNHIFTDSHSPEFAGYLLTDGSFIEALVPLSTESDLSSYQILDYSEFYIIPGIIDSNVHMNSGYSSDWFEIEGFCKQALTGGVTTVIDNPVMNHLDSDDLDEIQSLEIRKKALEGKISLDVGLLGYLGPHNFMDFLRIYEETGVFGFKIYLSQPFEDQLPTFDPRDLSIFSHLIKNLKMTDLVLSINCEMASNRDLFMASPCRNCPKEKRLDLSFDIHNFSGFGGGHHGVINHSTGDEEDSRPKSQSLGQKSASEDSLLDLVTKIQSLESNLAPQENVSPSTALLNLNSKLMSSLLEQKLVSDLELMEYSENSSSNLLVGGEKTLVNEQTNKKFDFQDVDSNLEISDRSLLDDEKFDEKFEEKENEKESSNIELGVELLNPAKPPKRFDSCPFLTPSEDFTLKLVFESALEEFKKPEEFGTQSDKIIEKKLLKNTTSLSSFGQRRKTFFEKTNGKNPTTPPSKFHKVAQIKTKTPVQHHKEMRKNRNYMYFLPNHPVSWEISGLKLVLNLFFDTTQRVILSNLSSPCLGFEIRENRKIKPTMNIFTDIAAPYLFFNKDEIQVGETRLKTSPPIRDKENQDLLVRSVKALIFDSVSSYHLAVPEQYKSVDEGNFRRAFNGISCIGATLSILWTKFYSILRIKNKKLGIEKKLEIEEIEKLLKRIVYLTSESPSKMLCLQDMKGSLKPGLLADFVVWDPYKIRKMHKNTEKEIFLRDPKLYCLNGKKVYGEVQMTVLRGKIVFRRKEKNIEFFENQGRILFNGRRRESKH